jgi:PAS domain S-box-containing protein
LFLESPVPTLFLGRDGTIQDINPAARRLLATSRERILGRPILSFVDEDDRPRVREFLMRALKGQTREWTTRLRRGDGTVRGQWVKALPSVSDDSVAGALVFCRDLTESAVGSPDRDQLGSLLENLPGQFTAVLDLKGRIRYSAGLARTHFLQDPEALGVPYEDLLGRDDPAASVEAMLSAVSGSGQWSDVQWHARVDGSRLPIRVFACRYLDPVDGRHLGVLLAGRDISGETSWRERAGRAEILAAVGEISQKAAQAIHSSLATLRDTRAMPEECSAALERSGGIAAALEELSDIPLGTQEIDLSGVVSEVVTGLGARAAGDGLSIEVHEVSGTGRPVARGSRQAVVRAVEELLSNALEAAGELSSLRPIDVSVEVLARAVVVRVVSDLSDADRSDLHRAFEPFFTTRTGHLGLGLSFVRSVAVSHDGQTWSEIDEDGRAVFAIQLPLLGDGAAGRFRPAQISVSRDRTVLIVDDEESVRVALRRFLGKVGFEVREAWSGRSALAQITAGRPPEILLTDIQMSDGAGDWLLDQLSRDFPDLLRKTLIITGAPDAPAVLSLARRTGCAIVPKPLDLAALLEMVDELAVRD